MVYTEICNAVWMYLWVGALLLAVILQCLVFMKKAWKHALELGLLLSLMPLLGVPLPWLRLSIIGSAYYETYAATTALECVGETMKLNEYSAVGWVAAAWVMTIGGSACVLWSSLAIKPISMLYEKAEKIDMKLVLSIGAGCLAGVMAYVSVSYGFSAMSTKGVVFCISFAVGALLVWIHNKRPKAKWLSDYLMTISMLVAMAAACIIF